MREEEQRQLQRQRWKCGIVDEESRERVDPYPHGFDRIFCPFTPRGKIRSAMALTVGKPTQTKTAAATGEDADEFTARNRITTMATVSLVEERERQGGGM